VEWLKFLTTFPLRYLSGKNERNGHLFDIFVREHSRRDFYKKSGELEDFSETL